MQVQEWPMLHMCCCTRELTSELMLKAFGLEPKWPSATGLFFADGTRELTSEPKAFGLELQWPSTLPAFATALKGMQDIFY